MNDPVKMWRAYAQEDLDVARHAVSVGWLNSACFHAQQCGEKWLKAPLTYYGQPVPRRKRTRALTWGEIGRNPVIPQGIVQHETWDGVLTRCAQNLSRIVVRSRMRARRIRWAG